MKRIRKIGEMEIYPYYRRGSKDERDIVIEVVMNGYHFDNDIGVIEEFLKYSFNGYLYIYEFDFEAENGRYKIHIGNHSGSIDEVVYVYDVKYDTRFYYVSGNCEFVDMYPVYEKIYNRLECFAKHSKDEEDSIK